MPYAAEGQISQKPIAGGIEISAGQYAAALDGMLSGKLVTIAGGFAVIDPPEPEPEPEPDPEPPTLEDYKAAIVGHLDATARSRLYDSAVSIATYVSSTNAAWSTEASAFVAWRDVVWAHAYAELDKVMNGQRTQPTIAAFIVELPAINWPS